MNRQAGIWIDHKEAFVVFVDEGAEAHVRFNGPGEHGTADDKRERQLATHLGTYYDEVISHVSDAKSILLFGPGEAKGELEKRLAAKGLAERVVGVETTDKMTSHQISAKVREHYEK
ncbi:MAG: hypothetical protein ABI789_00350 [Usitatibacter sp.]